MRVVAGEVKGRTLVAPQGRDTRPTTDKVRQAVCTALGSLGAVEGATVVDLFAGSGAMGIELLSRGAAHVVFVEHARPALRALHENLRSTGLVGRATVVPVTVERWLEQDPSAVDVAVADPPYAFTGWDLLLARLPAPLVVAESDREVVAPPGWATLRSRRYGGTVVTFIQRSTALAPGPPTPEGE